MADLDNKNPTVTVLKLVGILVLTALLAALVVLPYIGGLGLAARKEAAKFLDTRCNLTESRPPTPSTIYASDGSTVIARIFQQDRDPVPLSEVPKSLQDALLATEDRRFYQHHGVDMRGLIRSAFSTSSGDTQGGSTLTMQYVKQVRYYNDIGNLQAQQADISQNLNRKIEDAQCAIALEKHESKQTILANYLNIAFFGENAYSVEIAAETYFGKKVSQLSVPESAMLVGLLKAPTQYDPFAHLDAAKQRRNEVLQNMVDVHKLSQAQAARYAAQPVGLATTKPPAVKQGCSEWNKAIKNAGFFCQNAVDWLLSHGITNQQLNTGGLKIITTLSVAKQNSIQTNLWQAFPADAKMTAVIPVLDPQTGDILAMATNKHYGNQNDSSHTANPLFTQQTASGASTYKLFSLLTALKIGVQPSWQVDTQPNTAVNGYNPINCTGQPAAQNNQEGVQYSRNETLASGTAKSSNTFFVALDDQLFGCNLKPVVDMARSLGMTNFDNEEPDSPVKETVGQSIIDNQSVLQLALGSGMATSPLQITAAYAAVADGGIYNEPAPIKSVVDGDGKTIAVKRTPGVRVVAPQVAAQAEQILTGDTESENGVTGTSYVPFQSWYGAHPGLVIAGKTGTAVATDETKNAALWFVGMTPNLTAATAIFDPASSSSPITSLPNVPPSAAPTTSGSYASGVWLAALAPTLGAQSWTWPTPESFASLGTVPDITGRTLSDAKTILAASNYTMRTLDGSSLQCANAYGDSTIAAGSVAYYGPQNAAPGATVTVCPSSGITVKPYVYVPPPKPKPTTKPSSGAPRTPGGGATSGPSRGRGSGGPGR